LKLSELKEIMVRNHGTMPLAVIMNSKTVDPRNKSSTAVFQLETAMGTAIESFDGSQAILVPRSRFSPVKKTNDLLALRSDAYYITPDFQLKLADTRNGIPPFIELDPKYYKYVDQLDMLVPNGLPSLLECKKLSLTGKIVFASNVVLKGEIKVINHSTDLKQLPSGVYENQTIEL